MLLWAKYKNKSKKFEHSLLYKYFIMVEDIMYLLHLYVLK